MSTSIKLPYSAKRYFILPIISIVVLLFSFTNYEHLQSTDCGIENTAFAGGEKITYKAYYNWKFVWVPAGEAVFDVVDNGSTYTITVHGRTYKSYDPFFRVRDFFQSVIDKKTLLPIQFIRKVEEGDYRKYDSLHFYHASGHVLSSNGRTKETATNRLISIQDCSHDLLSVLYFMRNINVNLFREGASIPTRIFFDEKTYPINVRYIGKEKNKEIKDFGTFNTIKVTPDLVTGNVFKDGNKMTVWVSDDNNKIPLLIESPLSVGSAKAIIQSYKGIRNPLLSKK